jgi:hypothetical protein
MTELADERRAVQTALSEYDMHGWLKDQYISKKTFCESNEAD